MQSGALVRNIVIARLKTPPLTYGYVVGVRHGTKKQMKQTKAAGSNVNDPWYWFLHEFGFTGRSGQIVGPRPFLTPGFERVKPEALSLMGETMWKGILKVTGGGTS
jgi:hypothetical protein